MIGNANTRMRWKEKLNAKRLCDKTIMESEGDWKWWGRRLGNAPKRVKSLAGVCVD